MRWSCVTNACSNLGGPPAYLGGHCSTARFLARDGVAAPDDSGTCYGFPVTGEDYSTSLAELAANNGFRFKAFGLEMYGAWGPAAEGCLSEWTQYAGR